MGLAKLVLLSSVAVVVLVALILNRKPPVVPVLDEEQWWGRGEPKFQDISIQPFQISFYKELVEDIQNSLDRYLKRKPTPPLENQGFQYGFNTDYLTKVISYWRNNYQWKDRENFLNQHPQYKTWIQGLDIHFIRVTPTSTDKKVIPLLLLHGWPGSVREFYDMIPLLTTPRQDADFVFDVVVPSLPGYGFSQGAARPGLGLAQMAVVMKNLMKRLGFSKFYVQGGDWGAGVANSLGILYPDTVLGVHSNLCLSTTLAANVKWFLGSIFPSLVVEDEHRDRLYPFSEKILFIMEEMGYAHLHGTKPDTVGVALRDSPAGLCAYILEKFSTWTNPEFRNLPDGGLTVKMSMDALLDNVMIYYTSGCITTSMRLYAEYFSFANLGLRLEEIPLKVPTACARFKHDVMWHSETMMKDHYVNLVQLTDLEGGHFAALEEPKLLSEDVWSAVRKMEKLLKRTKV